MPSADDAEMMLNIISRMIDRAMHQRELSQESYRRYRMGTYDQAEQREMAKKPPKRRKVSKYARELGRQWKLVKKKSRKKNGDFKKGWNRQREMLVAHRQTKRAMKR